MMELTDYHAKYYAHELTKRSASDSLEKFSRTLADAKVDLNPHQVEAALFAFKSPLSKGAILADEVGLGKTIEAGILLSQKWAEGKRKILIICPSSLRKQWNQELLDKFYLQSSIVESSNFKNVTAFENNPFDRKDIVICSYHFAKNKEDFIKLISWDLVVIDEAHKLRNVYKNTNKISQSIKRAIGDAPKVLLTATPLQNSLLELYGLVSFIDEYTFGDFASFKSQFVRLGEEEAPNFSDLKERLTTICKRTLRRQVLEYIKYTNRIPLTQEFNPSEQEHVLYEKISEYLQKERNYALPPAQKHLMALILRRLLASSTFAIAGTLKGLISKLNNALETGTLKQTSEYIKNSFSDMDEISEELEETEDANEPLTESEKEEIKEEIKKLKTFSELADSIKVNAKGEELLTALDKGFSKLGELKAPKKALIFTEFTRTQQYIYELLSKSKYAGEVVLFNGSNNDENSNRIYQEWLVKNKDTEKISGSKSSDKRAAIIEYFQDTASIMIATEAAAEGINLQFCSSVVNYDLPWNPQRIEQRIGRCHRYGQNYDVVVVNFLNKKNEADQRVYELLDKKFQLFDGVFGASDQVLGAIESGINFEQRISQIYQECRTSVEIKDSFDKLQNELEEQISQSINNAKKKLLENFDEEVHEKLKINLNISKEYINKFEKILWKLTKHELSQYASFSDEKYSFTVKQNPFSKKIGSYKLGKELNGHNHIYRIGCELAQSLIESAKKKKLGNALLEFDYSNHNGRISVLNDLIGIEGDLVLWKLKLKSFDEEEYLIFTASTDKGKILSKEQCEKLFDIAGKQISTGELNNVEAIETEYETIKKSIVHDLTEKNTFYFDEEMNKLGKWGDDKKTTLRQTLKDLDDKIKILKKEVRLTGSLQDKLKAQKEIRSLDAKRDQAWKEYEDKKKEIDNQVDKLIDKIQAKMEQKVETEKLFAIRWRVK
jgi:ERCC4-related helicase